MQAHFRETPLTLGTRLDGYGNIQLSAEDRRTHTYIAGASGSGKSKLLEHIIRQEIASWRKHRCGMLLIDPHGSLYRDVMRAVAASGIKGIPIVPIDLTDNEYVVSYNVLRRQKGSEAAIVKAFVQAIAYVWGEQNTDSTPRFERWVTGLLRALYQLNHTLAEVPLFLSPSEPNFRARALQHLTGRAEEHWRWACGLTQRRFEEEVESTLNRLQRFGDCERLQLMFGVREPSFDFTQAMEEGWIVLVNASTEGAWGDSQDADTLATLMLADLWTAAAARGKGKNKRPFRIILDEFQRFISPSIARNLAEARGYGLHLTLSTQFPTQLLSAGRVGEDIFRNIMGNARSKIVFSVEEPDSLKTLAEWMFRGSVDPDQIKHEIYAMRAIGQKTITLHGHGEIETTSTSNGETIAENPNGEDLYSTRSQSGSSTSISHSEQESLASVYGKELASRQYRAMDEQFFLAMQKIVGQDQRHAYVRTASMKTPVAFRTPEVKPRLASDSFVRTYTHQLLENLPFALRTEAARKLLAERQAVLPRERFMASDEPTTAKRRIR